MKGDIHSFHMRYSSMICSKRLQSYRTNPSLWLSSLVSSQSLNELIESGTNFCRSPFRVLDDSSGWSVSIVHLLRPSTHRSAAVALTREIIALEDHSECASHKLWTSTSRRCIFSFCHRRVDGNIYVHVSNTCIEWMCLGAMYIWHPQNLDPFPPCPHLEQINNTKSTQPPLLLSEFG